MPPNASPKTQTTSPQPALTSPAERDHAPRGATSSQTPMPSWIQTAEAAAVIGWLDHRVTPTLTTCCTQSGAPLADGESTPDGSPSGIDGCSWSSPSSVQSAPNSSRSTTRAWGSPTTASGAPAAASGAAAPGASRSGAATCRRNWIARATFQATASSTTRAPMRRNWCTSEVWNAVTMRGLPLPTPRCIPVIAGSSSDGARDPRASRQPSPDATWSDSKRPPCGAPIASRVGWPVSP